MSLVICSNQESDSTTTTTAQSIFKPYSFRNALSNTYTIPKNGQVALQSCKYNLDGSVPLSGGDQILYQYYGQEVAPDESIAEKSTSTPIRTPIFQGADDSIEEVRAEEFSTKLATALNSNIFHPNLRDLVSTSVKRDATTNEFQGYQINYDFFDTSNNTIPATSEIIDQMSSEIVSGGSYDNFEWDGTEFTSLDPDDGAPGRPCVGVLAGKPLSGYNGSLVVDFDDPNSVGVEWAVGLTRYCDRTVRTTGSEVRRQPLYYVPATEQFGSTQPNDIFFFDYVVTRRDGVLKVYHVCADSSVVEGVISRELEYGSHAVPADYDINTNASGYTKVKFVLVGQNVEIYMVVEETEDLLYQYSDTVANASNMSAVHQGRWNLYPLLHLESSGETFGNSLTVEQFTACTNETKTLKTRINDGTPETISWFNSVEQNGRTGPCSSLETRPWNDISDSRWDTYLTFAGLTGGGNDVIDLENFLIMKPDDTYSPSVGANTERLLGFVGASPTNAYAYGTGSEPHTRRIFESINVPQLLASRSMFVRLEHMTQNSVNARQGNQSSIIAHLPRFDGQVETGRLFHEPKNLIFLDLNNSEEIKVSSFDISFVYSNEQFVQALTGQSVVCLYFRQDPTKK